MDQISTLNIIVKSGDTTEMSDVVITKIEKFGDLEHRVKALDEHINNSKKASW